MANPERAELQKTVDELTSATRKGSFQWRAANPTTYVWEKRSEHPGTGARITLQRVEQNTLRKVSGIAVPGQRVFVILQVHETSPLGQPLLKLNVSGADDPEINAKLEDLFQLISSGVSEEGIDFLKSLLEAR